MISDKAKAILNNIEKYLIVVLFTAMTVIVVFQITTRYGFGFTVAWMEQMARLIFVWLSFIGISYAAAHTQHIRMTAVATLMKGKGGKVLLLIGDIIAVLVGLYLTYKITGLTIVVYTKEQTFSAMPFVPIWVMYVSGIIGMLGFSIRTFQHGVIPGIQSLKQEENNEIA